MNTSLADEVFTDERRQQTNMNTVGYKLSMWDKTAVSTAQSTKDDFFARLVAEHARFMFRIAHGVLRNPHDAEDAVQEAFLKLYKGDSWKRLRDERAFLARTVWNEALDRTAKQARVFTPLDSQLASSEPNPERIVTEAAEKGRLRQLMLGLPRELREVLTLSAIREMNSREISVILDIPEGTVRTRISRAKAELKKRFEGSRVETR